MKSKFLYVGLSYSIQFLNIVLNLIFMQRLPPIILGDLAIAKIWLQAFDYTHLGTRFALDRYLPVTKRDSHRRPYLIFSLCVVLVGSSIVFISSMILERANPIVFSFCIVGITLALFNVIKAYFRAVGGIETVNKLMALLYVLPLTLSVSVALYSFSLFIWVYPLSFSFFLLFFSIKYYSLLLDNYNLKHFSVIKRKVSSVSFLLFFNSVCVYASFVVDRFFVDWYLGRVELGLYSVVMFVFASLFTIPSILTELVFPKVVYRVVNERQLFFIREMLFVFLGTAIAVLIANCALYFLVQRFTDYGELLPLMQLASLGVLPYSFIAIFHHVFNALDKRRLLFFSNASLLLIYVLSLSFYYDGGLAYFVYLKVAFCFFLCLFLFLMLFFSND
ncbi:hypothetical protein K6Y31_04470 [Motilimonas cestriensis]|uniref:Polysaccharide biosynthesis protein n=1 Tax=Motilimonas cestriensis TaxID=2742685 RepID=A0ABS8W9K0_9GAMM|nr:hypothetical protein [Motilimonas cestriensis]MCE2594065.1 hypothetical protein [Motilimonas cestriensis]